MSAGNRQPEAPSTLPELRGHPLDDAVIAVLPGLFARAFRSQGLSHYTTIEIEAGLKSAAGGSDSFTLFRSGSGLVAMLEGRPVGCGALGGADVFDAHGAASAPTTAADVATIRAFCTDPDFAGRGIGKLIMTGLLGMARSQGATELCLTATLSAVGFYEKCGFIAGVPFEIPGADDIRVLAMPMWRRLTGGQDEGAEPTALDA